MHDAAVHLVRRGLHYHEQSDYNLPAWGSALLIATLVVFYFLTISIEYTFGRLVPTLVMVESETAVMAAAPGALDVKEKEALDQDADTKSPSAALLDSEVVLVPQARVTRTLRSTVLHLRAIGGYCSRYHGVGCFFVWNGLVHLFRESLATLTPLPRSISTVAAYMLCAQFNMAWTHIVISRPSSKSFLSRLPSCAMTRKVLVPTFFLAVAQHATRSVPFLIASSMGLFDRSCNEIHQLSKHEQLVLLFNFLSVGAVAMVMAILFVFPANVVLTRMQAALLKEEDEPIVPFDRTFAGAVVPKSEGGSGTLSARDAWFGFEDVARDTLIKTYAKFMVIQTALIAGFVLTLAAEIVMIMGDDIRRFIPQE